MQNNKVENDMLSQEVVVSRIKQLEVVEKH